ncbi:serine hydrolase [Spirosoma validum]|uniref:Serine hydrolase n=1 Tax=Spirosoma validum TaxID=2771355 RepID=A0A927GGU1_9BACT|nr:serine hydrolase [Spirosoma validum]MBD2757239.1 serine hydrolase [Spirosoma validum]
MNLIRPFLLLAIVTGNEPLYCQTTPTPILDRAAQFQLNTPYKAPPGDALSHHTAGYAKIMCSAVFITGLKPDFAAENVGFFTSPYAERAKVGKPVIDYQKKTVSITLPNGVTRVAVYTGDQGCVCLAEGKNTLSFEPVKVSREVPDAATTSWPMGDVLPQTPLPAELDMTKVRQAVDAAFAFDDAQTAALVVTYKGRIIGERYGEDITRDTPLESWSMGKSLSATLMGVLMQKGVYQLDQPAPIPQWQSKTDPRAKIRISDIMHMSSGLYCRAPQDPDYDPTLGYPDHLYLYTGGGNSFEWAANLPPQFPPNTVGRYRNSDPVLINYLNRLGIEGLGESYHLFSQKELFNKLGIRTMIMETDPYGNFLTQGYEFASGRDWARLGNLYLQDGLWNGERLLPEGFVSFVSTLAKPWVADGRPIYGGLFWINGDGERPIPKDAYMMLGAGGQSVTMIPSHDLVIVRLGHYKGGYREYETMGNVYSQLMEAVPGKKGSSPPVKPRVSTPVSETILDTYVGVYEGPFGSNPNATFTVTREGNQLFEQLTGGEKLAIMPETKTKFFFKAVNAQLEFLRDASGKVVKRTLTYGGQTTEARKTR